MKTQREETTYRTPSPPPPSKMKRLKLDEIFAFFGGSSTSMEKAKKFLDFTQSHEPDEHGTYDQADVIRFFRKKRSEEKYGYSVMETISEIHSIVSGTMDYYEGIEDRINWLRWRLEDQWDPSISEAYAPFETKVRELGLLALLEWDSR